jgi:hypothetical protein
MVGSERGEASRWNHYSPSEGIPVSRKDAKAQRKRRAKEKAGRKMGGKKMDGARHLSVFHFSALHFFAILLLTRLPLIPYHF